MKTKEITTFRNAYTDYDKQCYFEGLKLAVLFDEKDAVKKWGAKWNQDGKFWWMPVDQLTVDVHAGIGTVKDWLNDHKMIVEPYGRFVSTENSRNILSDENDHFTEYRLAKGHQSPSFKVQFFYDLDVAKFIPTGRGELTIQYLTIEDGRKRWDELINAGYNRIENS
jgi:hypothetical protein